MRLLFTALACLISVSAWGQQDFKSYSQKYCETNFGVAYIRGNNLIELNTFPGVSYLIGIRKFLSEKIIFDSQIGIALPSLGTAKIGIGNIYFNKRTASIIGLRIWPTHIYIQQSLLTDMWQLQELTFSFEVGVPGNGKPNRTQDYILSMGSVAMVTIGYRAYFN